MAIKVLLLDANEVDVGWRARAALGDVKALADSIKDDGQLQPIVVSNGGGTFELIAGHRRLEACRLLDRKVIAMVVDPGDAADAIRKQIAENVRRLDFTGIELGQALEKYREEYQTLHPETKRGAMAGRPKKGGEMSPKFGDNFDDDRSEPFSKVISREMGIGETQVKDAIQLATSLQADHIAAIKSLANPTERRKAERQALSDLRKERRIVAMQEKAEENRRSSSELGRFDCGDMAEVIRGYKKDKLTFDLVLTDPPYSLQWGKVITHEIRNSIGHSEVVWDKLDVGWIRSVLGVLATDAAIVAFCPAEAIGVYSDCFAEYGLEYRGALVWWKTNPGTKYRHGSYLQATEYMVLGTKGSPYFKPFDNAGSEEAHNVLRSGICGPSERLGDHPTQKPVSVINQLLDRFATPAHRVLDPFAGVGTVPACCREREIWCAGIELDPKFSDLAKLRIKSL